jgi:hypothetical protein
MNSSGSDVLVRPVTQPPISHSVRDLLLTADSWTDAPLTRTASPAAHETDTNDFEANDGDIAEHEWDEVFTSLAEVSIAG